VFNNYRVIVLRFTVLSCDLEAVLHYVTIVAFPFNLLTYLLTWPSPDDLGERRKLALRPGRSMQAADDFSAFGGTKQRRWALKNNL